MREPFHFPGYVAFLSLSLAVGACGDDKPKGGNNSKDDASVEDTGGAPKPKDGGTTPRDSGTTPRDGGTTMPPDSGVTHACDPIANTGCSNPEICVWTPTPNAETVACEAGGTNTFEVACDPQARNCAAGYACLPDEPQGPTTCHALCTLSGGQCANLTGASANYVCARANGNDVYGACIAAGADCVAWDDQCTQGQVCSLLPDLSTACADEGTVAVGDACSPQNNCAKGGICLPLEQTPRCYEACDPSVMSMPCATQGDVCITLRDVDFGACQTPSTACDPLNETCPQNESCEMNGASLECLPMGTAARGSACGSNMCQNRDDICIAVSAAGPLCFELCDPNNPQSMPCSAGTCTGLSRASGDPLPFGICVI